MGAFVGLHWRLVSKQFTDGSAVGSDEFCGWASPRIQRTDQREPQDRSWHQFKWLQRVVSLDECFSVQRYGLVAASSGIHGSSREVPPGISRSRCSG